MRVTEQIDALDIMGINSASFLILPKILVSIIFFPILITLSMSVGIVGGWIGGLSVGVTTSQFILGIQYEFIPFYVTYALIKTVFFAFIITSVSAYYGYHTKGGAINVGESSTKAVVYSSILILIFNFILTDLILTGISF
jgi:phospholipid/cholesterol/gamma-HCH transport system permease protein